MNPILATLAGNVRTARRARGLSQEKLAELADLDPTLISRIERGLGNPALGTLLRIATALGADLSTLLRTLPAPAILPALTTQVFPDAAIGDSGKTNS